MMFKQAIVGGILVIAASGLSLLPVSAQNQSSSGDDANIQRSGQESVITGNGNRTNQQSVQNNQSTRRNSRGNEGSVQDNSQVCDIQGDVNACTQQQLQNRQNHRR